MGRDVPFHPDAKCDECGADGAFDFMGDYLCVDCSARALRGPALIGEIICKARCPICGRKYKVHAPDVGDQRICLACKIKANEEPDG